VLKEGVHEREEGNYGKAEAVRGANRGVEGREVKGEERREEWKVVSYVDMWYVRGAKDKLKGRAEGFL